MPDVDTMVESRKARVLTQYRESPKLLFLIDTYLRAAAEIACQVDGLPEKFDLDTAEGDQLTLVGMRLGFPRLHYVVNPLPVFGFDCDEDNPLVEGFSERGTPWADCAEGEDGFLEISDDEIYRRFLKARRYQYLRRFKRDDLTAAARDLFGERARILRGGDRKLVIQAGRDLTETEIVYKRLFRRVLPIPLGIIAQFAFHGDEIFGFGEGWAGLCDSETLVDFETESGNVVTTESGEAIQFESALSESHWACGESL